MIPARQSGGKLSYTGRLIYRKELLALLEKSPVLGDVISDQQQKGLETNLNIDRATASRVGISMTQIDNTLYDAFDRRQVSTIYSAQNQYHVVMEVAPRYWQSAATLQDIYVSTSGGSASGTETTNAVVGTFTPATTPGTVTSILATSPPASASSTTTSSSTNLEQYADRRQHRQQLGAQRVQQRFSKHRQQHGLVRYRRQHQPGDDGAAERVQQLCPREHAAGGEPPGIIR